MTRLDVDRSYPHGWPPVLLHHHLLQHASRLADSPALRNGDDVWSYARLEHTARGYAAALLDAGLHAGEAVTVCSRPSPAAVALLCALSMNGMVYVPLNPDHPAERLTDLHRITGAALHVNGAGVPAELTAGLEPLAWLDGDTLRLPSVRPESTPAPQVIESDPAYIIFTSGTTGRPKGIVMSHRAIVVGFRALVHHCALGPSDRVATMAPLSFDFSLSDMGLALGSGATLVNVPPLLVHHPARLLRFLDDAGVTVLCSVPWVWHACLQRAPEEIARLRHLRAIFVAGDRFPVADVRHLRTLRPDLRIVNGFGHSESMCCSFTDVPLPLPDDIDNIPIGWGHPGAEMFLLDGNGEPVTEAGVSGEIHVRGANLFEGYLHDEALTRRVLVPDPFQPLRGRVFKTGDHAYRGGDGQLYFAGRRDNQVQVLGMRVELEEVERGLARHPAVADAAVVDVELPAGTALVGFVTPRPGCTVPPGAEVRAHCAATLPAYMLPAEIHTVADFPTTVHGKVDRQRLRAMWTEARAGGQAQPA